MACALLAPLTAFAQPSACVVRGTVPALSVQISRPDESPFGVAALNAAVALRFSEHPGVASVSVSGALPFDGSASGLTVRLRSASTFFNGMVHLPARTVLSGPRADPALGLNAELALDRDMTPLTLTLPLRCEDVDAGEQSNGGDAPQALTTNSGWSLVGARIELRSVPGGGGRLPLALHIAALPCDLLETQGRWRRIRMAFSHGVVLTGWVLSSNVGRGGLARGLFNRGGPGPTVRRTLPVVTPSTYRGPALLPAGARLFVAPGGRAWTTLTRPLHGTVFIEGTLPWTQVLALDGLSSEAGWVATTEVTVLGDLTHPTPTYVQSLHGGAPQVRPIAPEIPAARGPQFRMSPRTP